LLEAVCPLSANEKSIRDRFAEEYITDYDQVGAAIRIGYSSAFAEQFAKTFMSEPYTRQRIKFFEESQGGDNEKDRHRRRLTTILYREANSYRPGGSSRVGAVAGIRALHGLDEPALSKIEMTTQKTTVQFYIPSNGRDVQAVEKVTIEPDTSVMGDLFAHL